MAVSPGDRANGRRAGIEALIPLATWSVRNRHSDFTKDSYEPWTWAAGIAQATEDVCGFTTAQVRIFPPVVAARLTTTVDHIASGRFATNVVCGHAGQALEGLCLPARLRALTEDERKAQLHQMVAGSFSIQILVGTPR